MRQRRFFRCALPVVLCALAWGIYTWVLSDPIRSAVIAKLQQSVQGYVELDRADTRTGGLTLQGLRIHETAEPASRIICVIPRIDLDGSLADLLTGDFKPTAITVMNPQIVVEQSSDGTWRIPGQFHWPKSDESHRFTPISVVRGQVDLPSRMPSDRPTAARRLTGINLNFTETPANTSIQIAGKVNDPLWNRWNVSGVVSRSADRLQLRVQSDSLTLTPTHKDWCEGPLAEIWEWFQPAGSVSVNAELSIERGSNPQMQYRILIDPRDVSVHLATIPLPVEGLTGRIEVSSDQVRLHSLAGRIDGGEIIAAGTVARSDRPTIDIAAEVRHLPVARLIDGFVRPSQHVSGMLTGKLIVRGELADPDTWVGAFEGALAQFEAESTSPIELHATIADGVFAMDDLEFEHAGGRVRVTAHSSLDRDAVAQGDVRLESLDLAELAAEWPGETPPPLAGRLDGAIHMAVPLARWADRASWEWSGPIRLRRAEISGVSVESFRGVASCKDDVLVVRDARATSNGREARGEMRIDLAPPHAIDAQFELDTLVLGRTASTVVSQIKDLRMDGQLSVSGRITGTLRPSVLAVRGRAILRQAAFSGTPIEDVTTTFTLNENRIEIEGDGIDAFGGRAVIRGSVMRNGDDGGELAANIAALAPTWDSARLKLRIDASDLDLSRLAGMLSMPNLKVNGRASGYLELDCPLRGELESEPPRANGHIDAMKLLAGDVRFDRASADFECSGNDFIVRRFSATCVAGTVLGSARLVTEDGQPVLRAEVSSAAVDIDKLRELREHTRASLPVHGSAKVTASVRVNLKTGSVHGAGTARCAPFMLDGFSPIESAASPLEFDLQRLTLESFRASAWGGTILGKAVVALQPDAGPVCDVSFDQISDLDMARLTAAWPAARGRFRGKLYGRGTYQIPAGGTAADGIGKGSFELRSGSAYGLPVTEATGTITSWMAAPPRGPVSRPMPVAGTAARGGLQRTVQIEVRSAKTARGPATGRTNLTLTQPVFYHTHFDFQDLELGTVASSLFASQHGVTGRLSGDITLTGSERGLADSSGDMRLRIRDAQLWPHPFFSVVAKVMNLNLTKSGAFRSVDTEVFLANGQLEVPEARLVSDVAQMYGSGALGLDGSVDFRVVGNIGSAPPRNSLLIGSILDVWKRIQQHLVEIKVTGTIDDPTAVPVPLQDVSEPAINFFKRVFGVLGGTEESRRAMPEHR